MARVRSVDGNSTNTQVLSIDCPIPSGTVDGDLLVACVSTKGVNATLAVPSGWTAVDVTKNQGGWVSSRAYYKTAASETSTQAFTSDISEKMAVVMARIDEHNSSTPINVFSVAQDTDTPSLAATATTTAENTLLLSFHASRAVSGPITGSQPTGMTEQRVELTPYSAAVGLASQDIVAIGATGTRSWPLISTGDWVAWNIVIDGDGTPGGGGSGGGGTPSNPPTLKGFGLKPGEAGETGIYGNSFWVNQVAANARIKIACPIIFWDNIETSKDVYDFSVIDDAISNLPVGKELALEFRWWSFGTSAKSTATLGVPAYMYNDHVTYGGVAGFGGLALRQNNQQYKCRHWDTAVADRMAKVLEAILTYCDGKAPKVVFTNETTAGDISLTDPNGGAQDYTVAGSKAAWTSIIERGAVAGGTSTRLALVMNFIKFGNNGIGGDVDDIADVCRDNNVALSCPDPFFPSNTNPGSGAFINTSGGTVLSAMGIGTSVNPTRHPSNMPLGELGAGAFDKVTGTAANGYTGGANSLLDWLLHYIRDVNADAIIMTHNSRNESPVIWSDVVSLFDDATNVNSAGHTPTSPHATVLAEIQAWNEADVTPGGTSSSVTGELPYMSSFAEGAPTVTNGTVSGELPFMGGTGQGQPVETPSEEEEESPVTPVNINLTEWQLQLVHAQSQSKTAADVLAYLRTKAEKQTGMTSGTEFNRVFAQLKSQWLQRFE